MSRRDSFHWTQSLGQLALNGQEIHREGAELGWHNNTHRKKVGKKTQDKQHDTLRLRLTFSSSPDKMRQRICCNSAWPRVVTSAVTETIKAENISPTQKKTRRFDKWSHDVFFFWLIKTNWRESCGKAEKTTRGAAAGENTSKLCPNSAAACDHSMKMLQPKHLLRSSEELKRHCRLVAFVPSELPLLLLFVKTAWFFTFSYPITCFFVFFVIFILQTDTSHIVSHQFWFYCLI